MNVYKYMRKNINLTQKELADKIGIGRSAVARWETGAAIPRSKLLTRLANVFGCTIDELLFDHKNTVNGICENNKRSLSNTKLSKYEQKISK